MFFTKVSAIKTLHSMYLCGPTKQNTPGLGGRYCVTLTVFSMWYPVYFENIFSSIFRLVFVPTHLSTLSCSIHYLITWWQRESMISECQWWIDWYAQLLEASLWEKGFRQNFALSFFLFLFQSLLNLARLWLWLWFKPVWTNKSEEMWFKHVWSVHIPFVRELMD